MATAMATACIIEFAVITALIMMCLWLKNRLSKKHTLPLQARGLSLPSPIEIDGNKSYGFQPTVVEVRENEAYGTNFAHRITEKTAKL